MNGAALIFFGRPLAVDTVTYLLLPPPLTTMRRQDSENGAKGTHYRRGEIKERAYKKGPKVCARSIGFLSYMSNKSLRGRYFSREILPTLLGYIRA